MRARLLARSRRTGDPDLRIHYADKAAIIESRTAISGEFSTEPRDRRRLGVEINRPRDVRELIPLDYPELQEGRSYPEPNVR